MKPIKVGICGLGTVGSGTLKVLLRNQSLISVRAGRTITIAQVASRHDNHTGHTSGIAVTRNVFDVAANPEIDIVVELIGGYDTAKQLILSAIKNGKHVVTANKALIAEHGNELFAAAQENNVIIAYEAAVAGGIPIIKCLKEALSANKINWLAGIINGTANFILTEMGDKQRSFPEALKAAQDLGYAEADPTFDIEGIDACHKLTIMASIAFGIPLQFSRAYVEGISHITPTDISYAETFGYRIKHLGIARHQNDLIELRVHPALLPTDQPIAHINDVLNSVVVDTDALGQTMYTGPGAGAEPTASAVIADIIDIARLIDAPEMATKPLGYPHHQPNTTQTIAPIETIESGYYLRIHAADQPGVMNAITQILGTKGINIRAISQKSIRQNNAFVDVVIITEPVTEALMENTMAQLESLADVQGPMTRIRIERMI